MWIAMQREVAKILMRFFAPLPGNCLLPDIAPQHLGHFDIEEMRSVQGLGRGKDTLIYPNSG